MPTRLRVRSQVLMWGLVGAAASRAAVRDAELVVQDYYGQASDLGQSLENVADSDSSDRKQIVKHYNETKQTYLLGPLSLSYQQSSAAVREFSTKVEKAGDSLADAFGNSPSVRTALESCWDRTKMSELKSASKKYDSSLNAAVSGLAAPYSSSRSFGSRYGWSTEARADFSSSLDIIDQDWAANAKKCCKQGAEVAVEKADAAQKDATATKYQAACKQYEKDISDAWAVAQPEMQIEPPGIVPDPIKSNPNMDPPRLAATMRSRSGALRQSRARHDAGAEENEFAQAEADCRKRMQKKQNGALSILGSVASTAAQTAMCVGLPLWATQRLQLPTQQMILGLATLPIPGVANCNPAELAPYSMARDPSKLDSTYGITAMLMPLQRLKQLPMQTAGFWMRQNPDGSFATSFGPIGAASVASTTGANALALASATGAAGTSGRTVTTSSRRVAASRGLTNARSGRALASTGETRGLTDGAALSRSARTLASDISRGQAPFKNASRLRSDASTAHRALATMVANNAKQSPQQRRRGLASEAATVRTAVRKLSSTRVSRTTNGGTLASLRGRTRKTGGAPQTPLGGTTYEDMKKNAEKSRQILINKVKVIADNVQGIVDKAEQTRQEIFGLINQAEVMTANLYREIIPLPPYQQAERVYQNRVAVAEIQKQIAPLKVAFDAYQGAILEQKAALMTLGQFVGPGVSMPGLPSNLASAMQPLSTTGTSTGSSGSSGDRSVTVSPKSAEEIPAPAGFPVRTTSLEEPTVLDWLNPIKSAWASTKKTKLWSNDEEWAFEWDRLMKDWDGYLEGKQKEERKLASELAQLVDNREKSITWETMRDSDTDYVSTLNLFSKTLEEETTDLITATDLKGPEQLNLDGNTIQQLRQAREEARGAREALIKLAIQYKEARPESDEENPEAWWSVVPGLLVE